MSSAASSSDIVARAIAAMPLFQPFDAQERKVLAGALAGQLAKPGDVLYEEKRASRALFIVVSGQVNLYKELAGKARKRLAEVPPNTLIGVAGLLDGRPYTETAIAARPTVVLRWDRELFEPLFAQDNPLAFKLMWPVLRDLSRRTRVGYNLVHATYAEPQETLMLLHQTRGRSKA